MPSSDGINLILEKGTEGVLQRTLGKTGEERTLPMVFPEEGTGIAVDIADVETDACRDVSADWEILICGSSYFDVVLDVDFDAVGVDADAALVSWLRIELGVLAYLAGSFGRAQMRVAVQMVGFSCSQSGGRMAFWL